MGASVQIALESCELPHSPMRQLSINYPLNLAKRCVNVKCIRAMIWS